MFTKLDKRVIVRLSDEMHSALLAQSDALGLNISGTLRLIIAYWLADAKIEDPRPATAQIPEKEVP